MTRGPKIRTDLGAPCPYCAAARACEHSASLPVIPLAKRPHDRAGWIPGDRGFGFRRPADPAEFLEPESRIAGSD